MDFSIVQRHAELPNPHFERLGGEAALRRLTEAFYQAMDTLPEARRIRAMHPTDLNASRQKLYEFLVGWTGGPALYVEKYGHPRLRQRHQSFAIGEDERDAWMRCMDCALITVVPDESLRRELRSAFFKTADFLRNRPSQ